MAGSTDSRRQEKTVPAPATDSARGSCAHEQAQTGRAGAISSKGTVTVSAARTRGHGARDALLQDVSWPH
ncbi:hypothetical protein GCM10027030_30120 [Luteococcus sediminum]